MIAPGFTWDARSQGASETQKTGDRHVSEESGPFRDHDLVAFAEWPSATAVHTGEEFLGPALTGKRFVRRSLDFWRIADGQIRENRVMADLLDLYGRLGVDILARMAATTGTREEIA